MAVHIPEDGKYHSHFHSILGMVRLILTYRQGIFQGGPQVGMVAFQPV